jgi:hypothetical protein
MTVLKFNRPDFAERLTQFVSSVDITGVKQRIESGQQFNCYEAASNRQHMRDASRVFRLCLGPVDDALHLCDIQGITAAMIVEAALKVATEAMRERTPA